MCIGKRCEGLLNRVKAFGISAGLQTMCPFFFGYVLVHQSGVSVEQIEFTRQLGKLGISDHGARVSPTINSTFDEIAFIRKATLRCPTHDVSAPMRICASP